MFKKIQYYRFPPLAFEKCSIKIPYQDERGDAYYPLGDGRHEEAKPKLEATREKVKESRLTPERIRGLRKKLGISMRWCLGRCLTWKDGWRALFLFRKR
jgi:hypothetical protein